MKTKHILVLGLLAVSSSAFAHPGHGLDTVYAGWMHPFTGWDHLLVMLAVGVWAGKLGGSARWQLPLTFVSMMALGAVLAWAGLSVAGVDTAVAASVMAMGVLLLIAAPIHTAARIGFTAIFAVLHGMAHGVELAAQNGLMALLGMLLATSVLHGAGLLLAKSRLQAARWLQPALAWLMLAVGAAYLMA